MPTRSPDRFSGDGKGALERKRGPFLACDHITYLRCFLFTLAGIALPSVANGQERETINGLGDFLAKSLGALQSFEILLLAIFGGAMSFALLSASWLIRERARIVADNQNLKRAIADMRMASDRNESVISLGDQRIIVWNGPEDAPAVFGELPRTSGTPMQAEYFAQFQQWIDPDFLPLFEQYVTNLREQAIAFSSNIKTKGGAVLEVIGSTSGGYAIVKFCDLSGVREELSQLRVEHQNLNQSFEHVELLLSKIPIPVWLKDASGRLSWVNDAYANALEMENPKAAVAGNYDLFDAEQRQILEKESNKNKLYDSTLPATVAGDRKKLRVMTTTSDTGGAGLAIDTSEVDEVRRLLRETNDGNSKMLDQMATAVAIFDSSQRLIFHNGSFQQLWKLDPSLLEGNPSNADIFDAMRDCKLLPEHPDWRKWREAQLEIYTAIEPVEEWWHLVDGQTIRVVASPRSPGGSTWIFENVTERLALEKNYNALMRVQGETLDHLNEAVAVFGSNGQLKLFNPALSALWSDLGLSIQEGLHISKIVGAWEPGPNNMEAMQILLGGVTGFDDARTQHDDRMLLNDGRTLHYAIVPLPDGQTMLTFIDVTASVNFEKALHDRAEALEASDLLKSKFIQHVSYELRAPLTTISGFGEILKLGDVGALNSKQSEYVSHINESAGVLAAIVDDILDLASIDAGTMKLDLDTVELDQTVKDAFETYADAMRDKGLKAVVDIAKPSEKIMVDGERLLQILQNIISNAINFSPDGGTITLTAKQIDAAHEIRITDQGPGIGDAQASAIFDRFETQPGATGKTGTGLGLSIVKGFVELHGGSVAVDTEYRDGTCFVCKLPIQPTVSDDITRTSLQDLAVVA